MAISTHTDFSLFIIESLNFKNERNQQLEGKILRDALRMSRRGLETEYLYIRTYKELMEALRQFNHSNKRYLHISCHGNNQQIALTLDTIPFEEFGTVIGPYINKRRLFFSACQVVNENLADAVINGSGCYSLIGPKEDISFGDAAMMWASFYHLMFRDPQIDSMKGGKIRWALRRVHYAFGENFDYFNRSDNRKGYKRVDISQK